MRSPITCSIAITEAALVALADSGFARALGAGIQQNLPYMHYGPILSRILIASRLFLTPVARTIVPLLWSVDGPLISVQSPSFFRTASLAQPK